MNLAGNDHDQHVGEPQETGPASMDFPALAQQVTGDVEELLERAEFVNDDLLRLTTDFEWESPVAVLNLEDEIPLSPNELLAQLNGIAATAYRLARSVHPLIEARTRHLIARADRERS
jgi:hypothetical protein